MDFTDASTPKLTLSRMAASGHVSMDDLTNVVCKCKLCNQTYNDPIMLPCLHSYCRDCLVGLTSSEEKDRKISCPECQKEIVLPKEGVNGFKSDFQIKYISEHLRLVTSIMGGHSCECCVCGKISKVSAYCYKCGDYLCIGCYGDHPSRRCFKDHESHVFSSKDLTSKSTTFEKLASVKKDPRCTTHPQNVAQLCCITCNNLPVCVVCIQGKHKEHKTGDVIDLAKLETEKLRRELETLEECRDKLCKMKVTVKDVKLKVEKSFSDRKTLSQSHYEMKLREVESKLKGIDGKVQSSKMEVVNVHKEKMIKLQQEMERELKSLNDKYNQLFEKEDKDYKSKLGSLDAKLEGEKSRLNGKRSLVDNAFKEWVTSTESEERHAFDEINHISHHFDCTANRLEGLIETTTRVVASKHDWTVMECIPVIRAAIEPLVGDASQEFPQLDSLLKPLPNPSLLMILWRRNRVSISEVEKTFELEGLRRQGFQIRDMTSTDWGKDVVVISGEAKPKHSHITLVDYSGLVKKEMDFDSPTNHPWRFCASLSDHSIATVCEPEEIGVIHFRDFVKLSKSISDVIPSRSDHLVVSSVCADSVRSKIFVGCKDSKDVQVFNIRLERTNTVILPDLVGWPRCIAFCEDNLLVCDFDSKIACAVSMEGELLYKFQEPSDEKCDRPLSVCTDRNGFIYVLWVVGKAYVGRHNALVVQYSQDGGETMSTIIVDGSASCIATVKQDQSEHLLVATWKSAKIYWYKLMQEEE